MKALLTFVFVLGAFALSAQSLVPNGDFESSPACPPFFSGIEFDSNPYVDNWLRPTGATSDYFHECADAFSSVSIPTNYFFQYQYAHSGVAYGGFYVSVYGSSYREYLQVQLAEPMLAEQCYYVEFYTAPAEVNDGTFAAVAIDELGLYISVDRLASDDIYYYDYLDVDPQIKSPDGYFLSDTLNWIKISGIYVAEGGEEWITIGNFQSSADTETEEIISGPGYDLSYYAIDDVSITALTGISVLPDSILCVGESLLLESVEGADSYTWNTGETTEAITVTESGTYVVTLEFECGVFNDTAEIIFINDGISYSNIDLVACYDELPLILEGSDLYISYNWSTGETTSDISVSESGTYVLTAYGGCATFIDSFLVDVIAEIPEADLPTDILICEVNGSIELSGPDGMDFYSWSTGENTQFITVSDAGDYNLDYGKDCDAFTHVFHVFTDPFLEWTLDVPDELTLCPYGSPVVFIQATPGFPSYNWSTGATSDAITVAESGTYTVNVQTLCLDLTDSVRVVDCEVMEVPNAFSPNNDGYNDLFSVLCNPCDGFRMLAVYNRWGETVFETTDPNTGWDGMIDGTQAPVGAYAWVLQYATGTKQGQVILIR